MKFEELLLQPSEGRRRRLALEEEVEELQQMLDGELRRNNVLRWAIKAPSLLSPNRLPFTVEVLLTELAMVEEEIIWLERKLGRLFREEKKKKKSSTSFDLELNLTTIRPFVSTDHSESEEDAFNEGRRHSQSVPRIPASSDLHIISTYEDPNRISEQLLTSLISVFLKMSKASELETDIKHNCITSRGFPTKSSITVVPPNSGDAPPYKLGYTHITRSSFDKRCTSDCNTILGRIRVLLQKLCHVDLAFLSYKQKLAFWINVYNACIMNAYLQHGLPSTQERMLSLMNKAALNVGGIVLNALAIEHYVVRHPHDSKHVHKDVGDDKEMLLRRAYGLRYPEPNVTFALCRGNWSSPALKVYTPEEVVNELESAKIEYLEACVGIRSKKKILVPKLLQWHMHDFADDLESLIEWIYSQLPQNGLLKMRIMECLINVEMDPIRNLVDIVPYQYEFRYLISTLNLTEKA